MRIPFALLLLPLALACLPESVPAQISSKTIPLDHLVPHGVKAEPAVYRGRQAVRLTESGASASKLEALAVVSGTSFHDGTIEVALSGNTAPSAPPDQRGFVGIAFRVSTNASHFECFYLRPKNGRSENQLQRNHSAQYISVPGFPWEKLRSEAPGQYESYVDLIPGEWTKIRIQVQGSTARLYVNGAIQPTLIVNDLKQKPAAGSIALWIGPGTIGNFADLKVSP
jgi:hypothetical protein